MPQRPVRAHDGAALRHARPGVADEPGSAPDRLGPLLAAIGAWPERERLRPVNDFFNRHLVFRDDALVWGVDDHWASPLEALERGVGDCEDYAIGKYFSLLATGVPMERLRLIYGRVRLTTGRTQAHMVLGYRAHPNAPPLLLDNLTGDIVALHCRPDLSMMFSFNGQGLWQGIGDEPAGDPLRRLPAWGDVLARARAEGFPA